MFRILVIAVLLLSLPLAAQTIYRVKDAEGNWIYTDRKPDNAEAEEVDLPELNVVEPGDLGSPEAIPETDRPARPGASERAPEVEFSISSPAHEETVWNTAMQLPVRISLGVELPPGAQIVLFLDGQQLAPIQTTSTTLEGVERGPHTLRAELQTASGRVLARTEPVTFFMRQQSALHPRPG